MEGAAHGAQRQAEPARFAHPPARVSGACAVEVSAIVPHGQLRQPRTAGTRDAGLSGTRELSVLALFQEPDVHALSAAELARAELKRHDDRSLRPQRARHHRAGRLCTDAARDQARAQRDERERRVYEASSRRLRAHRRARELSSAHQGRRENGGTLPRGGLLGGTAARDGRAHVHRHRAGRHQWRLRGLRPVLPQPHDFADRNALCK